MEQRLADVRQMLKKSFSELLKTDPKMRLTYQVMDLELLKYAINELNMAYPELLNDIDNCIQGFIWLYRQGGKADRLPDSVGRDPVASSYYASFSQSWSRLQEFMRSNMSLTDI